MATSTMPLAWACYRRGELTKTLRLLDERDEKQTCEVHQLKGLVLHDLGRAGESADELERASLLGPIQDEARIALASSYAQLKRIDLARELYLQLALGQTLSSELMLQVAAGLEAIDSPQLAMKVCEWITEADDSVAQAFYDMGFYAARSGQPLYLTEALTRRAMQLAPENIHFRIGLVSLLVQLDRDDEALAAFEPISSIDFRQITCVSCLLRIAEMLKRQGLPTLAALCSEQTTELKSPVGVSVPECKASEAQP
ncbi:MAG: tetratricopeptide repeat protein [Rhodopirellula sp. JB055]|uniref:tetratricopeptide repeat protein n=1 Tax=Rhodopirellula sp. JB055 TaxID=3342846 RepID=UPI00370A660B